MRYRAEAQPVAIYVQQETEEQISQHERRVLAMVSQSGFGVMVVIDFLTLY